MKGILEAIDKSIRKWQTIVNTGCDDGGTSNCGLCQLMIKQHGYVSCTDCPAIKYVAMRDGTIGYGSYIMDACGCGETPWSDIGCNLDLDYQRLANHELSFLYEVRLACLVTKGTFNVPTE